MGITTRISVLDVALVVVAAALPLGVLSFAGPCGIHDDGSVSTCFWAGRSLVGVGAAASLLAVARLAVRNAGLRQGIDLALVVLGVLAAVTPGALISLCMMATMRCHTIMRPFTLAAAILLAALAAADLIRLGVSQRS